MTSSRPPARIIAGTICAAAFLCGARGASAQPSYKQAPTTVSALDVRHALARNAPISSRNASMVDVNEAARRLGQAQLEREQGAEPLSGEHAEGMEGSAVNLRYWQRQEKLRLAVEQAQRRSNEAHRPQGARLKSKAR
jgi:hypothetical protein